MWAKQNLFIGSHLWFVRSGTAFTSPVPGAVDVNNCPDVADPLWPNWNLGNIESVTLDPKFATAEEILAPSPGRLVKVKTIVPYQTPLLSFTLKEVPKEAIEQALGAGQIDDTTADFNPTAGTPGMEGYLKVQNYDQDNNLILNFQVWCFLKLKTALKGDPKAMTKPEFDAEFLYSPNNIGSV